MHQVVDACTSHFPGSFQFSPSNSHTTLPEVEHKKSASEFEIYFNFFFRRHPHLTRVRHASWCNGMSMSLVGADSEEPAFYDFVSFHDTFRNQGGAAKCITRSFCRFSPTSPSTWRVGRCETFCCCKQHEDGPGVE
eukprot:FR737102.1.p1 GENE.FR737102.1~~FR737102.1.p1  ORF type:complete len:136 (+),score=2.62 FR737102.1:201-608(+)